MKRTPVWKSLLKIHLCLLIITACFFRKQLLPLSGMANFIVSAAALVLTIISIRELYKAICSIMNEIDP